jgi:hypothetical protein
LEERDFLSELVLGSLEANAGIAAIGGPSAGVNGNILRQGEDVQQGRPHLAGPRFGQRKARYRHGLDASAHRSSDQEMNILGGNPEHWSKNMG